MGRISFLGMVDGTLTIRYLFFFSTCYDLFSGILTVFSSFSVEISAANEDRKVGGR